MAFKKKEQMKICNRCGFYQFGISGNECRACGGPLINIPLQEEVHAQDIKAVLDAQDEETVKDIFKEIVDTPESTRSLVELLLHRDPPAKDQGWNLNRPHAPKEAGASSSQRGHATGVAPARTRQEAADNKVFQLSVLTGGIAGFLAFLKNTPSNIKSSLSSVRERFGWKAIWSGAIAFSVLTAVVSSPFNPPLRNLIGKMVYDAPVLLQITHEKSEILPGETITLTALATGESLTYNWTHSSNAEIIGNGQSVKLKALENSSLSSTVPINVQLVVKDKYERATPQKNETINLVPPHPSANDLRVRIYGPGREIQAGEIVPLEALVSDNRGDEMTYDWSVSLGRIEGNSQSAILITPANVSLPTYVDVILTVQCSRGIRAVERLTVTIKPARKSVVTVGPKNFPAPEISLCQADRTSVHAGEIINLTSVARDPSGGSLTYEWASPYGVMGHLAIATLDTSTIKVASAEMTLPITLKVKNERGVSAYKIILITVKAAPPSKQ